MIVPFFLEGREGESPSMPMSMPVSSTRMFTHEEMTTTKSSLFQASHRYA